MTARYLSVHVARLLAAVISKLAQAQTIDTRIGRVNYACGEVRVDCS